MIIRTTRIISELTRLGVDEDLIKQVKCYKVNHPNCNLCIQTKNDSDSRNMVTTNAKSIEVCDDLGNNNFKQIMIWHTKH